MMYIEEQPLLAVDRTELVSKVAELKREGHRLVQICATTLPENFEITYSFDLGGKFTSLRVMVARSEAVIPSITGEYFGAFSYENELQDLFGLQVTDLKLNYNGNFFQMAKKTPFAEDKTTPQGK